MSDRKRVQVQTDSANMRMHNKYADKSSMRWGKHTHIYAAAYEKLLLQDSIHSFINVDSPFSTYCTTKTVWRHFIWFSQTMPANSGKMAKMMMNQELAQIHKTLLKKYNFSYLLFSSFSSNIRIKLLIFCIPKNISYYCYN